MPKAGNGVAPGDAAPDFELEASDGSVVRLSDLRGRKVVLYFYPKDNTSGCTREAVEFTAALPDIDKLGAVVLGVSRDSPRSHARFIEKHSLGVRLLSDPEASVHKAYGAWGEKKAYGKVTEGVIRSTFLIDEQGVVRKAWRKVKVAGHVDQVLEALRAM